jgi:hypothetical protein
MDLEHDRRLDLGEQGSDLGERQRPASRWEVEVEAKRVDPNPAGARRGGI